MGSMVGKVCLVTGGTSGIGLVAARALAARGAAVAIVGRDPVRCESRVRELQEQTGNPLVEFFCADLSSQSQVRRVASEFRSRHDRLHVLINNAGAFFSHRQESADGIEMTLALNHLAYFLLTTQLLDTIKASAPARIINVSSRAHEMVKQFDFTDPQARDRAGLQRYGNSEAASILFALAAPHLHPGMVQYAQSKLANLLFTLELARRLEGTGVTVNALHPGFVATGFTAGNGVYGWFMRRLASVIAISAEEGARTIVHLATSPEVEGITGRYFAQCKPASPSAAARDPAAAQRLWQLSEELTAAAGRSPQSGS
jgi:NAD(P)-dependent dehydrogenase (short-subunit alcohol dehydrogenase family)